MLPSALSAARRSADPATLAIAGVICRSLQAGRRPLIRGIDEARFRRLVATHIPGFDCPNGNIAVRGAHHFEPDEFNEFDEFDEFDDIVALLLDHRAQQGEEGAWLAYAIATAAMGDNHLWQDLGLPSRSVLSSLMQQHFPTLAALNTGDMKWKKFFYRQLCERAGVMICKSPNCAECCDYRACFGAEES